MAYCGQCGAQVQAGAAFCASCGAAASVTQQQPQQQQQWQPRMGGFKNWPMQKKALATIVVLVLVIIAFAWCRGGSRSGGGRSGFIKACKEHGNTQSDCVKAWDVCVAENGASFCGDPRILRGR